MPKVGPRRTNVVVRMSAEGIAELDRIALIDGLIKTDGTALRSDIIRNLLNEAIARRRERWPRKYKPKEEEEQ